VSPNPCAVLVKSEGLQLRDLVVRQAEILLMLEEIAKDM
jgi:hypothetical protein